MAFGDIAQGNLERFLDANRFADELCIFIHIPKTAGSSLSAELNRMRPPYHNIHRRYFHGETVTFSRIEDEIAAVIDSGALGDARSCSGHFSWDQAAPLRAARPDARAFTFLRDPVKRVISDYRYSRTPTHPTYKETIERFPTVESYIEANETQDKMARFMLPNGVRTPDQIDAFISTNYAFIGLLEMYPLSFNILSLLLGHDRMPSEHKRKTEDTADNAVEETPALREMIAATNQRDSALYELVRLKLLSVREDWRAFRQTVQPAA
ncbi:sulfotransferase family 2 domain-containing protein [Sphingomonas dokdonensis]|uniref:Sulfotransferase family protein n=1 Tax=Sphingomonas dokdonensis TaxID=344880 RepID=A0A245ZDW2_9SPHN|nr:sulfotransferase family 2 domain-containing protein [Sphingomonas dokdonensis]OWK27924.1 sulfotransferase family protein [Sphingomonas dokdonensis]